MATSKPSAIPSLPVRLYVCLSVPYRRTIQRTHAATQHLGPPRTAHMSPKRSSPIGPFAFQVTPPSKATLAWLLRAHENARLRALAGSERLIQSSLVLQPRRMPPPTQRCVVRFSPRRVESASHPCPESALPINLPIAYPRLPAEFRRRRNPCCLMAPLTKLQREGVKKRGRPSKTVVHYCAGRSLYHRENVVLALSAQHAERLVTCLTINYRLRQQSLFSHANSDLSSVHESPHHPPTRRLVPNPSYRTASCEPRFPTRHVSSQVCV
jgi:hypothetical protein